MEQEIQEKGYAQPEALVTTDWVAEHLEDEDVRIVESDEDVLLYDIGHVPNSVKIDWVEDLNDPLMRDYLDPKHFAELMGEKGIMPDTTVVFYGDKNNWWATYALWVFRLFGHDNVRVMDGGRLKWEAEGRGDDPGSSVLRALRVPGPRAGRREDPGLQGRRRAAPGEERAAGGRAEPRRVLGRAVAHAGLSPGGCDARRPHPRRGKRAVGAGR